MICPKAAINSASADGHNNLKLIAVVEQGLGMLAARYDFAILLDGNTLAGKLKNNNKFGNCQRGIELARFAIDGKRNHGRELPSEKTRLF